MKKYYGCDNNLNFNNLCRNIFHRVISVLGKKKKIHPIFLQYLLRTPKKASLSLWKSLLFSCSNGSSNQKSTHVPTADMACNSGYNLWHMHVHTYTSKGKNEINKIGFKQRLNTSTWEVTWSAERKRKIDGSSIIRQMTDINHVAWNL